MNAAQVEALAKIAYEAHRDALIQKVKLDPFEKLPAMHREAWRAVARAVSRALPSRE